MARRRKRVKRSLWGRVLKAVGYQTGKRKSVRLDRKRKAKKPGKRVSKKTGRVYWETRRNRSDLRGGI
jgi:hypothetical protein